ncbi:queuine tRNA-ribosyltransferase catalytic subunit 1 [Hyalella azteca]|uniref:Queuine tRNA-ribosyltransferase catalytic subunit 1 n=1 Tax=Hyalella azteca TaxID=294128 RepID=A0A8B7PF51_HYAAZ|nr:queuine tRNA-ribosyltransferase catalytic subunit 1 [Hyalella azteca]
MSCAASKSWCGPALQFNIVRECSKSRCRVAKLILPHHTLETPTFMPVGTKGTMKGLLPEQVADAGADIILGNTYHLGTQPGKEVLSAAGGLHQWMQWPRALLTDSGGFQMVSLLKFAKITEDGVTFQSPYDGSECVLTPEESIAIQNAIGADIMMQLDDVVDVKETNYERFKEATLRTTRWLDRCIAANKNTASQNLFPIVQGGVFTDLRDLSLTQLMERDSPGYAIGGLSGGEDKEKFWPIIEHCTRRLPQDRPRYCMGVGFAPDLVVCVALGVDMFDCVYPTRTARFGCALVDNGQISLKSDVYASDFSAIDDACSCSTCHTYTRAYIHALTTEKNPVGCHLLSIHNIAYQMQLMSRIRASVKEGKFTQFAEDFFKKFYRGQPYPRWVVDSMAAVNIHLKKSDSSLSRLDVFTPNENEASTSRGVGTARETPVPCPADATSGNSSDSDFWLADDEKFVVVPGEESTLSGFAARSFDRGYRDALRRDYPEEEELGRSHGYLDCFKSLLMGEKAVVENGGKTSENRSGSTSLELDACKKEYIGAWVESVNKVLGNVSRDCNVLRPDKSGDGRLNPYDSVARESIALHEALGKSEPKINRSADTNPTYVLAVLEGNLAALVQRRQSNMTEEHMRQIVQIQNEVKRLLDSLNTAYEKSLKLRLEEARLSAHFEELSPNDELQNNHLFGNYSREFSELEKRANARADEARDIMAGEFLPQCVEVSELVQKVVQIAKSFDWTIRGIEKYMGLEM